MSGTPTPTYGYQDTTYQAAGGEAGIRKLVDDFYRIMGSRSEYQTIFSWHPTDGSPPDKLTRFLCGWMGGARLYQTKYGPISIPQVHAHLPVTRLERDMWLSCMRDALNLQPYPDSLKDYLFAQLSKPAELIRFTCEKNAQ